MHLFPRFDKALAVHRPPRPTTRKEAVKQIAGVEARQREAEKALELERHAEAAVREEER